MSVIFVALLLASAPALAQNWQDPSFRHTLRSDSLEASFQAGMLYGLKERGTGRTLMALDPRELPADLPLFAAGRIDLNACIVTQQEEDRSVQTTFQSPDGVEWSVRWSIDAPSGDLVLESSARTPVPVDEMRIVLPGCNLRNHTLVYIHGYGVSHAANAPWEGQFLGDPMRDGSPMSFPHPLVALFQGHEGGFFVEGREERIGPANLMIQGAGRAATLGFTRRFPIPTDQPKMYEIRIRAYNGQWETAVDPYVKWLEEGAGLIPFDKLPPSQAWVGKLKTQAYVNVGDYENLEALARRVNPAETFVGRQAEMRNYGFDIGYPDYSLSEKAKEWTHRARELGFHVGMHFNVKSVSVMFPDLIEKFRPGFGVVGKDEQGNDVYDTIYSGPNTLYRVSAGLKAWREHLIGAIEEAVNSGVDVIYLDEAMSPGGKFMVDGVDGYQGLFLLMKEILDRYPHVAIETEQFNTLTGKYGKLALSQMPLGHPLSGYIFQRFIKVAPEGVMYSPTETALMDAFDAWGFMLPGADPAREQSWMQIAEAFHTYQLLPDARLARTAVTHFADHFTHGAVPEKIESGEKIFGFSGAGGVTAYLERHPTRRGLVIYQPGQEPKWIGARQCGITTYAGAGVPAYFGFREYLKEWLIYDDEKILGLDPGQTYWFDETVTRSPTRFHVFKVPDNFSGVSSMDARTAPQEVGRDDAYFFLRMAGKGEIGVYVPDEYEAYLNGQRLEVDPQTRRAIAKIDAAKTGTPGLGYHIALNPADGKDKPQAQAGPAVLMAFRKTDTPLLGNWTALPWHGSNDSLKWITGNAFDGYYMAVGATGRIVGRFPNAKSIRMQGAYQIRELGPGFAGDGVVRINGVEVLRIPHGEAPFPETPFDVDLTAYAGQYVLFEFTSDGPVRAATADWKNPRFVVEP